MHFPLGSHVNPARQSWFERHAALHAAASAQAKFPHDRLAIGRHAPWPLHALSVKTPSAQLLPQAIPG
jgi:hypothetical protein